SVIVGDSCCARSPVPVRLTTNARCPAAHRPGRMRFQHQAPCQAPCTSTKSAIRPLLPSLSFNYLVGADKNGERNGEPKGLGGVEYVCPSGFGGDSPSM